MARALYYGSNPNAGYGIGGISGDRFTDVAGWESGTVGFAGNVYSRLASENGIQPVDPAITASREPFRVGRFLLKILKLYHSLMLKSHRLGVISLKIPLPNLTVFSHLDLKFSQRHMV